MPELYIGIMSGTSLDGIDAVLVNFDFKTPTLVKSLHHDFDKQLRDKLLQLTRDKNATLAEFGEIDHRLGLAYANIVDELLNTTSISASDVKAIGSHGQTIYHQPETNYPLPYNLVTPIW